jgi:SAM-dependent methyltransferase
MKDEDLWSDKAKRWHERIGSEGDLNRRINSDPVLWRMVGDPSGLDALDAGCGTAYLAIKLAKRGARVTAVDFSEGMMTEARRNAAESGLDIKLARDSCSVLETIPNESFDLVISNYVLMDLDDIESAVKNHARVLRPGGRFVAIFTHPCFDVLTAPQTTAHPASRMLDEADRQYGSYFDCWSVMEAWGEFNTPFRYYHRPLAFYWKLFLGNGFAVLDFEEPVVQPPYPPDLDEATIKRYRNQPFSVAFLLRKVK